MPERLKTYPTQRLNGLDGLRAIAIMILVWGHCSQNTFISIADSPIYSIALPGGCLTILFFLSGFLAGYFADKNCSNIKSYYKKRAIRLLPTYYLYILIVALIYLLTFPPEVFNERLWYYIVTLGIIPFSSSNGILPYVHLWFISSIVVFYLIFPIFAKLSKNHISITSLLMCCVFFFAKVTLYHYVGKETMAYRLVAASQWECIFMGVCWGSLAKNKNSIVSKVGNNRFITLISWCLFLFSGLYATWIPAPLRNEFYLVIALSIVSGLISQNALIKIENKFWNFMGDISYNIFIIHIGILLLIDYTIDTLSIIQVSLPLSIAIYTTATGVSILLAWLTSKYINAPITSALRSKELQSRTAIK